MILPVKQSGDFRSSVSVSSAFYYGRMEILMLRHDFRILSFLPVLLMMLVIFRFSAQEAETSTKTSTAVGRIIISAAARLTKQEYTPQQLLERSAAIDGIVRKAAHMAEYGILAAFVSFPLLVYGVRRGRLLLLTFLIPFCFAATDEFHQTFVRGRSGSIRDVLIDSVGIITYVIILLRLRKKRNFTKT